MKVVFLKNNLQIYVLPTIKIDFDVKEINIYWLIFELTFDFWK